MRKLLLSLAILATGLSAVALDKVDNFVTGTFTPAISSTAETYAQTTTSNATGIKYTYTNAKLLSTGLQLAQVNNRTYAQLEFAIPANCTKLIWTAPNLSATATMRAYYTPEGGSRSNVYSGINNGKSPNNGASVEIPISSAPGTMVVWNYGTQPTEQINVASITYVIADAAPSYTYQYTITCDDLSTLEYSWGMTPEEWNAVPADGVVGTSETDASKLWLNVRPTEGYELETYPSVGNAGLTNAGYWSALAETVTTGTTLAFTTKKDETPAPPQLSYNIISKVKGTYLGVTSTNLHLIETPNDTSTTWYINPLAGATNDRMTFTYGDQTNYLYPGSTKGENYNGWSKNEQARNIWLYELNGTTATRAATVISGKEYLIVGYLPTNTSYYQLTDSVIGTTDCRTLGQKLSGYTEAMESFTFNGNPNAVWIIRSTADEQAAQPVEYSGFLDIEMGGQDLAKAQPTNIYITATGEGKCTFSLLNFTLGDLGNLGDIVIPDVIVTDSVGQTNYSGAINGLQLAGGVITADVSLNGYIKDDGTILFNIPVTWMNTPISVKFYYPNPSSEIAEMAADASVTRYYDLAGREVKNPENGVFIRVNGNKATKVIR